MTREPRARDVMKRPVKRVTATASVREATAVLLRADVSGALVVDAEGAPVGVFSLKDVASYVATRLAEPPEEVEEGRERASETGEPIPIDRGFHFHLSEDVTVGDMMTRGVITVKPGATLGEVARIMTRWKVHRVFVDDRGVIVGVVTTMDVLRRLAGSRRGTPRATA